MLLYLPVGQDGDRLGRQDTPSGMDKTLCVELSSDVLNDDGGQLDSLIGFAFDTLGVCVLDVRITPIDDLISRTE